MGRLKSTITTVYSGDEPRCPHCGADMGEATVSLTDLLHKWPISGFLHVAVDGYAHPGDYIEASCQECFKPCAVRMEDDAMTLVAARTHADRRFKETL